MTNVENSPPERVQTPIGCDGIFLAGPLTTSQGAKTTKRTLLASCVTCKIGPLKQLAMYGPPEDLTTQSIGTMLEDNIDDLGCQRRQRQ
jgi:hypothetical protein